MAWWTEKLPEGMNNGKNTLKEKTDATWINVLWILEWSDKSPEKGNLNHSHQNEETMAATTEESDYEKGLNFGLKYGYSMATHDICLHIKTIMLLDDKDITMAEKYDSIWAYVDMLLDK